jgi:hypothetical protein
MYSSSHELLNIYFTNTHLAKFRQNADLWTIWLVSSGRDEGIGESQRATQFLKIKRIIFILIL